jgi:4-hydroxy-tetrahydrodipicolinate synthase
MASTRTRYEPAGVIPACILPFNADFSIDEKSYRSHLRDLAAVKGVSSITTNGHAAEVSSLSFEEQRRVMAITRDELKNTMPVVAGIFANSGLEAARLSRMAQDEGADCLLVFPPDSMAAGGSMRPEMAIDHFARVADASDLPIILFQYALASNLAYPLPTLLDICRRFPQIRAIKDYCGDGNLHERQIRELRALDKPVKTLTTHSAWLLGSLAMGCDGLLSGAGSVIAALQVELFNAVQKGDLKAAQRVNDRIYPTVRAFYDHPLLDMHNRMKEALVLLGRLPAAHVRPPLQKLTSDEIAKIGRMLKAAGLMPAEQRAVA